MCDVLLITKHIEFLCLVSNRERVAQRKCEQKQIEAYAYLSLSKW
jgi:hypothetical protein